MFPYIFVFCLLLILVISNRQKLYLIDIILLSLFLIIFIGFRYDIGPDWDNYTTQMLSQKDNMLSDVLSQGFEIGYRFLEFITSRLVDDILLLNVITSIAFIVGLISYCKRQPYPWLSILIAYPTLILLTSFSNNRQAVSLGFELLALSNIQYFYRTIFYFVVGTTFHGSMIGLLPLAFFARIKKLNKINNIIKIILFISLFIFIVSQVFSVYLSTLYEFYILSGIYNSKGAIFRIGFVAISAVIFQLKKDIFYRDSDFYEFSIYNVFSFLSILSFFLVLIFPLQSTAIDRMGYYLYPLSIFVYARCVQYRFFNLSRNLWKFILISMIASITFYWLANSYWAQNWWIPYENYLFM